MAVVNGLEVNDLVVEYSSGGYAVRPLDGLDLSVQSGELVLLLGASGCGKTTLLSALAGILSPTAGTIRVGDVEVTELRGGELRDYRRATVGIVFQAFNLIPSLTARENVEAPLRAARMPGRTARARSGELLEQLGLDDRASHRPGDLSGGQQQRVAIARALAHDPPLLLADEPTAHLDYVQVDSVLQQLRRLAAPGRVVVVATHDERLLPLADRVVSLSPHRPASSQPPVTRRLSSGETVFEQGDAGDLVYVVDGGEVEIVRRRVDADDELVTRIGPGSFFGELAPLFGLRRSACARAGPTGATITGYSVTDFRARVRPDAAAGALATHPEG
jgi:putative ABC transport system ATP-binding protein